MSTLTDTQTADNPFLAAGAGVSDAIRMKFNGNSGDFIYGQDEDELEHGSRLAANMHEAMWNWSFWWDDERLETVEKLVVDDPRLGDNEPDWLPDNFPDGDTYTLKDIQKRQKDKDDNFSDGWRLQAALPLREVDGENREFILRMTAKGAIRSFKGLMNSFGKNMRFHPNEIPVIEIGATSYTIKGIGKKYSPVLQIVEWLSEEELMGAAGEDPSLYDNSEEQAALPSPDEGDSEAGDEAQEAPEAEDKPQEEEKPRPRGRRGARGKYAS